MEINRTHLKYFSIHTMIIGRTRLRRQALLFHSSSSSRPSCLPSLSLLSFFRVFRPCRAFRCCSRCRLIATVPDNFVVGPPCLPSIPCLPFYPLPPPCPIFLYTFFDFSQFFMLIFLNFIFLIHFSPLYNRSISICFRTFAPSFHSPRGFGSRHAEAFLVAAIPLLGTTSRVEI